MSLRTPHEVHVARGLALVYSYLDKRDGGCQLR